MSDEQAVTPVFQIQRVYLKDLSLEQPNSPAILLEQEQPSLDIQLAVEATPVADGIYEVAVQSTVQTKIEDKTVFLVEAKQAGIFEIRGIPEEQLNNVIGISCPQILYPYLRGNVADIINRAELQSELLDRAAALVKPGGTLVYAVCSLERAEGEDQLASFLSRHADFTVAPISADALPAGITPNTDGTIRQSPPMLADAGGLDGFFVAKLVRG